MEARVPGELPAVPEEIARRFPAEALGRIREDMQAWGGPYTPPADREGSVGCTMFDTATSEE